MKIDQLSDNQLKKFAKMTGLKQVVENKKITKEQANEYLSVFETIVPNEENLNPEEWYEITNAFTIAINLKMSASEIYKLLQEQLKENVAKKEKSFYSHMDSKFIVQLLNRIPSEKREQALKVLKNHKIETVQALNVLPYDVLTDEINPIFKRN